MFVAFLSSFTCIVSLSLQEEGNLFFLPRDPTYTLSQSLSPSIYLTLFQCTDTNIWTRVIPRDTKFPFPFQGPNYNTLSLSLSLSISLTLFQCTDTILIRMGPRGRKPTFTSQGSNLYSVSICFTIFIPSLFQCTETNIWTRMGPRGRKLTSPSLEPESFIGKWIHVQISLI